MCLAIFNLKYIFKKIKKKSTHHCFCSLSWNGCIHSAKCEMMLGGHSVSTLHGVDRCRRSRGLHRSGHHPASRPHLCHHRLPHVEKVSHRIWTQFVAFLHLCSLLCCSRKFYCLQKRDHRQKQTPESERKPDEDLALYEIIFCVLSNLLLHAECTVHEIAQGIRWFICQ